MEEQLIPYRINESGEVIVSARALHEFLQIKTPLNIWMPRMIEYGFEEMEDYQVALEKYQTAGGIQEFKDYLLSADMSKEICMLQRSDRGRQARLYFINLEKKFNSPEAMLDRLKKLLFGSQSSSQVYSPAYESYPVAQTRSEGTSGNQLVPAYLGSSYVSENFSDLLTNFRDAAKIFGIKENMLINWMILRSFCYRDKYGSVRPYANYMKYFAMRPFQMPSGRSGIQTLINSRGVDFFSELLLEEGITGSEEWQQYLD